MTVRLAEVVRTRRVSGAHVQRLLGVALPAVSALALQIVYGCGIELILVSAFAGALWFGRARHARDEFFFIAASLLALAFPVAFATTLRPFQGGVVGNSDSRLYNDVALYISQRVSILGQLNPFSFGYVREAGLRYGYVIAAPGYFKILGIVYTFGASVGLDGAWVAVAVNIIAVAIAADVVVRAARALGANRAISNLAGAGVVLYPVMLDVAFSVQKDALIIAVWSSLWYVGIFKRSRARTVLALALALVPLRMVFAALTLGWVMAFRLLKNRKEARVGWGAKAMTGALVGWLGIQILDLPFTSIVYFVNPDADYLELLGGHAEGATGALLSGPVGRVVYALLYPFPPFRIPEITELHTATMLFLGCATVVAAVLGALAHRGAWSVELRGIVWGFIVFMTMGAIVVRRAVDEHMLGILEPRYKLPLSILSLLMSVAWLQRLAARRSVPWPAGISSCDAATVTGMKRPDSRDTTREARGFRT